MAADDIGHTIKATFLGNFVIQFLLFKRSDFWKKIEVPTKVQNSKLLRRDNLRLGAMTSQLRSDVNHAPLLNYFTLASPLCENSQLFDFVLKLHENVTIDILLNFSRCMCSGILFKIFAKIGASEKSPKTKSMSVFLIMGFSIQPQKKLVSRYHHLYLGVYARQNDFLQR